MPVVFLGTYVGVEGAKAIGEALKTNETVTTVDLSCEKCYFIYETISFLKVCVCLLVNEIGAEGAKAICEMLKTNKTVTTVILDGEKYI